MPTLHWNDIRNPFKELKKNELKTQNMKSLLIALFLLVVFGSGSLIAQSQTGVRFGIKAGYSIATQYGIKVTDISYEIDSDPRNGFTGGIFFYFPITDAFGVQQEFLYTQKGSGQNVILEQPPVSTSSKYKIDYFEIPIVFRYNFINIGNIGIYGSSGFGVSMLLAGEYEMNGVIDIDGTLYSFSESGNTDGLDTFDYSFIYGLGLNFNLFKQKCFFDYRQTIGWNTLMMPTAEGEDPAPLRNMTYSLSLGIVF